jgi:hypothetical protein
MYCRVTLKILHFLYTVYLGILYDSYTKVIVSYTDLFSGGSTPGFLCCKTLILIYDVSLRVILFKIYLKHSSVSFCVLYSLKF